MSKKKGGWIHGEIVEFKERFNKYHYIDPKIKPVGKFGPTSRLSVPYSLEEESFFFKLMIRLNVYAKEGLIGKRVYYRSYKKQDPKDKSHFFRIIDSQDILTEEEYNQELKIKRLLEDNEFFSVTKLNEFFNE